MENSEDKIDVALSFAGEQRDYVEEVAKCLKNNKISYFLDSEKTVEMWGLDLIEYFDEIYRKKAKLCVMFISENYKEKVWTIQEKRSALARALEEKREYILPARFDDTEISGIRPTIGYVDLKTCTPEKLCDLIIGKLGLLESKSLYIKESGISHKSYDLISQTERNKFPDNTKIPNNREEYFSILCSSMWNVLREVSYLVDSIPNLDKINISGEIQKGRNLIFNMYEFYYKYSHYSIENIDKKINEYIAKLGDAVDISIQAWRANYRYYKKTYLESDEDMIRFVEYEKEYHKIINQEAPNIRNEVVKEIRNILNSKPNENQN